MLLSKTKKTTLFGVFLPFVALVQKAGAKGAGLSILRELSYSIFLKASVSNTLGLSNKLSE